MFKTLRTGSVFYFSESSAQKQALNWNWPGKCLCQQASTAPNWSEPRTRG